MTTSPSLDDRQKEVQKNVEAAFDAAAKHLQKGAFDRARKANLAATGYIRDLKVFARKRRGEKRTNLVLLMRAYLVRHQLMVVKIALAEKPRALQDAGIIMEASVREANRLASEFRTNKMCAQLLEEATKVMRDFHASLNKN